MAARARAARTFKDDTAEGQIVSTQIQSSLSLGSACPATALSLIHFCASGGVDHSRCCRAAGVQSECIEFCDQVSKLLC
ncbi:unnamed protein product [Angiostrongylus costaricensis]|uniref:DB domain-containing protein n=1 Tax=Angiostrongylus costaricensis TaxID=334426 RepID=A0A0R3PX74_ANGCS|nr:unnamed protein product [Angiostrongylus costaricensis]